MGGMIVAQGEAAEAPAPCGAPAPSAPNARRKDNSWHDSPLHFGTIPPRQWSGGLALWVCVDIPLKITKILSYLEMERSRQSKLAEFGACFRQHPRIRRLPSLGVLNDWR